MVQSTNYWFSTRPKQREDASGVPKNADIVIIGGGIAGVTLLYQLVNLGITDVCLVEESNIATHASGRSSGQLMLRGHELFSKMDEHEGREYLTFMVENNHRFINGLRKLNSGADLRETGGLRLAVNNKELKELQKESEFISSNTADKIRCPILSEDELNPILASSMFVGGMYVPNEATFNPYTLVSTLKALIDRRGKRIITNAQVESVIPGKSSGLVVSIRHKGTIRAKRVVYCTNAYTPTLLPELSECMTSFRGQMIATDVLPSSIFQALPAMSITCNDSNEYFRLHNGRLLVGGMRQSIRGHQRGILSDGEISPALYDKLKAFAVKAVPLLNKVKFSNTWSSIMCETTDRLPLIGPIPGRPNEFIMGGFNGFGYSHMITGSHIIKDYMESDKSVRPGTRLFNPERFF